MKVIDILGENRTGKVLHVREASRAVIFRRGKLLLTRLANGDVYMLPGGGMDEGETPEEACAREAAEETGLTVTPVKRFAVINEYYGDWKYATHYFVCDVKGRTAKRLTEAEEQAGLEMRWMSFNEAFSLFGEYRRFAETFEEKRGIYEREFEALRELFHRCPEAALGDVSRLAHPPVREIVPLPKEKWALYPIPFEYDTDGWYDLKVSRIKDGFQFRLTRKQMDLIRTVRSDEWNNQDKLYQPWWEKAQAWGVVEDGKLLAAIETCPEEWSNRLQVTELWVSRALQGEGVGKKLLNLAKEQTVREKRRALILETQTCNVNAIGFYLNEGMTPIGLDTCCYSNRDIQRKEVRLNMGWFPEEEKNGKT